MVTAVEEATVTVPVETLIRAMGYRATADVIGGDYTTLRRAHPGLSPKSNPGRRRRWDVSDDDILDLYRQGLGSWAIRTEFSRRGLRVSRHLVKCRLFAHGIGSDPRKAQGRSPA